MQEHSFLSCLHTSYQAREVYEIGTYRTGWANWWWFMPQGLDHLPSRCVATTLFLWVAGLCEIELQAFERSSLGALPVLSRCSPGGNTWNLSSVVWRTGFQVGVVVKNCAFALLF